jgi:hypothetical protein
MKSFHIKAAVYRRLHKKHPLFAREMKKMERKQKYEKEFISAVRCFLIFVAFMTHIIILPAKSCIAWSALGRFKWITNEGPGIRQREARGPNTTDICKQAEG